MMSINALLSSKAQTKGTDQRYIEDVCPLCGGHLIVQNNQFTCVDCWRSGDAVDFFAYKQNISHKTALNRLEKTSSLQRSFLEINQKACDFYTKSLSSSAALNYLRDRKISKDSIQKFDLGFAPKNGLYHHLIDCGFSEDFMVESGLFIIGRDGHIKELLSNRLIFPIRDEKGQIVSFGGRRMYESDYSPKYINGPENCVFHKKDNLYGLQFVRGSEVYLVEGYMDVISMHQHGFTNTVAALGTAITNHHLSLLKENHIQKVILCMDGDEAGIHAAKRSLSMLIGEFEVEVLQLKQAKDPDEFLKKFGTSALLNHPRTSGKQFLLSASNTEKQISLAVDLL